MYKLQNKKQKGKAARRKNGGIAFVPSVAQGNDRINALRCKNALERY